MRSRTLPLLCLLGLSVVAHSAPATRSVVITKVHPMAVNRLHCPTCSGYTRIYVQSAPWGNTTCRTDAADLAKEDSHLLSVLMTAWVTGKQVVIEVNDASRPIDEVCRVTAMSVL